MSEPEINREDLHEDTSSENELKKIAMMYHVVGNYAKSDEIMGVVRDLEAKRRASKQRRDAA